MAYVDAIPALLRRRRAYPDPIPTAIAADPMPATNPSYISLKNLVNFALPLPENISLQSTLPKELDCNFLPTFPTFALISITLFRVTITP
jgi:hypothetical protein